MFPPKKDVAKEGAAESRSIEAPKWVAPLHTRKKSRSHLRTAHGSTRHAYIHRTGRSIRIQIKNRILRLIAESAQNTPPARIQRDRGVHASRRAIAIESKLPRHLPVADDLQMIHSDNRRHLGRKFHFLLLVQSYFPTNRLPAQREPQERPISSERPPRLEC